MVAVGDDDTKATTLAVLDEAARDAGLTKETDDLDKDKGESRLSIGETWHPLEICMFLRAANDHDLYASEDPKGVFDRSMEDVRATLAMVLENPRELDDEALSLVRRVATTASKRNFEQFKLRLQNLRKRQCRSESGYLLRNAFVSSLLSAIRIGRVTLSEIENEFLRWKEDSEFDMKDIENATSEDIYSLIRRSLSWSTQETVPAYRKTVRLLWARLIWKRDEKVRKEISEDGADEDGRATKRRKTLARRRALASNGVDLVDLGGPGVLEESVEDEDEVQGLLDPRSSLDPLRAVEDRELRRLKAIALREQIGMMRELTKYYRYLNESAEKEKASGSKSPHSGSRMHPIPFPGTSNF